jgi:hypothetical protein
MSTSNNTAPASQASTPSATPAVGNNYPEGVCAGSDGGVVLSASAWARLTEGGQSSEFGDLLKRSADKDKKDEEEEKDPSAGAQRPVFSDEAPTAEQVLAAERTKYLNGLGVNALAIERMGKGLLVRFYDCTKEASEEFDGFTSAGRIEFHSCFLGAIGKSY